MFEQTFKNIDDILHRDTSCVSELDYVEQTFWLLFPCSRNFKDKADSPDTIGYYTPRPPIMTIVKVVEPKIGEISTTASWARPDSSASPSRN